MNFAAQVMDCPLEPGIIFLKLTIWCFFGTRLTPSKTTCRREWSIRDSFFSDILWGMQFEEFFLQGAYDLARFRDATIGFFQT